MSDPGLQRINEGYAEMGPQPLVKRLKLFLAKPWNYQVKPRLKAYSKRLARWRSRRARERSAATLAPTVSTKTLQSGDLVRVRSQREVEATLDRWKELKGCAFLEVYVAILRHYSASSPAHGTVPRRTGLSRQKMQRYHPLGRRHLSRDASVWAMRPVLPLVLERGMAGKSRLSYLI